MKQKKDTRVGHKKHEKNENKWGPNKKMKKTTKNHEDPPKKMTKTYTQWKENEVTKINDKKWKIN